MSQFDLQECLREFSIRIEIKPAQLDINFQGLDDVAMLTVTQPKNRQRHYFYKGGKIYIETDRRGHFSGQLQTPQFLNSANETTESMRLMLKDDRYLSKVFHYFPKVRQGILNFEVMVRPQLVINKETNERFLIAKAKFGLAINPYVCVVGQVKGISGYDKVSQEPEKLRSIQLQHSDTGQFTLYDICSVTGKWSPAEMNISYVPCQYTRLQKVLVESVLDYVRYDNIEPPKRDPTTKQS